MRKENFQSPGDRDMMALAYDFELSMKSGKPAYMDSEDLADLADWYACNGEHGKAMMACQYGLHLHPRNSSLLIEQAYLYLDEDDVDRAEKITDTVPEQNRVEVIILRAHLLAQRGDEKGVKRLLESIKDFGDAQNAVEAAYLYSDIGRVAMGIKLLEGLRKEFGKEEAFLACLGDCYSMARRYKDAVTVFNELIDHDPYSPRYWSDLARAYFCIGRYDKAIEACDYALVADEEYVDAHRIRSYSFYALGNEEEALKSYELARKFAQDDDSNEVDLTDIPLDCMTALQKVDEGDWEDGLSRLKQIIQETPEGSITLPVLYANAALCEFQLGNKRKAYTYCRKAKQADPDCRNGYLMEGHLRVMDGDLGKAIVLWKKAMKISPDPDAWFEIGNNCMNASEASYALYAFEQVLEMDPDYSQRGREIYERLTVIALVVGDKEKVIKYNALCSDPIDLSDLSRPTGFIFDSPKESEEAMLEYLRKMFGSDS